MARQVGEGLNLEKKVEIQKNVIIELKDSLKEKENLKPLDLETEEENRKLVKEIEKLQMENKDKIKMLETLNSEKDNLQNKLELLECKNEEVKEEKLQRHEKEEINLGAELNLSGCLNVTKPFKCKMCETLFHTRSDLKCHFRNDHEKQSWKFQCNKCEKEFETRRDLRNHMNSSHEKVNLIEEMKMKANQLKTKLSEQKCNLVADLFRLKEQESREKRICKCRGVCKINHFKQNWNKSQSAEMFYKFKDSFQVNQDDCQREAVKKIACTNCEESFEKLGDLGRHT